jgi:chemotaxis protein histidine kinase CheA
MPPKKRRVSDKKPQQPTDPLKVRCLQAIKAARKAGEDLNEASENDTALDGMTKVAADCQRKVITLVQEFAERQSHILDPTARRSSETYEVQMGRLRLLSLIQELKQATTGTKPACIDNMKKVAAKLVENASREFGPQARSSWMPSIKMNEEGQQKSEYT